MLCQSGGARSVAPRPGGRCGGPFKALTAGSLLALVGAAAVAPAQAGDLNGKVSTIRNEEEFGFRRPDVFDWSGVYVGAHLGAAWGDVDWSGPVMAHVTGGGVGHELGGSLAGGHLGFNHQLGRWVGGVEVSLSDSDVQGSSANEIRFGTEFGTRRGDIATRTEIDSLFLATVRLGYAFDRTLAYVKGGYASAEVNLRAAGEIGPEIGLDGDPTNYFPWSGPDDVGFSSSERHSGFTVGGGLEHAFTNRVTFGLEYSRVDLGSATHIGFAASTIPSPPPVRVEPDVLHVAMARLSLKFGDDGGVLPAMLRLMFGG
jgi:outer membrane immunogenic protein